VKEINNKNTQYDIYNASINKDAKPYA